MDAIARIARAQQSAFTTAQALSVGYTREAIEHRVQSGIWVRVHRATFVVAGSPDTWERKVSAAVLSYGPNAVASFVTAGRLHNILDGAKPEVIHVTLPPGQSRTSRKGIVVHTANLKGRDFARVSGVPVTGPHRTIVDLASYRDEDLLETAIDDAVEAGKISVESLRRYRIERGLEHSRGGAMLSEILRDRIKGVPQKKFERMFIKKMRATSLPEPARQFWIGEYRVDFAYPDLMIAIELDGRARHLRDEQFDADRIRWAELQLLGWLPLPFTWKQVTREWPVVEDIISRARMERGAGAAGW